MYVCHCFAVNDRALRAEIEAGALDAETLAERCGAGAGCGSCAPVIEAILELHAHAQRAQGEGTLVGINRRLSYSTTT